jgi:SAM-dependent methyltransferase
MNSNNQITKKQSSGHKHTWVVTSIGIILTVFTIVLLPQNKNYSMIFIGIAGGHLIIALIAMFTGWIIIPQKFFNKIWKRHKVEGYDFGWSPKWLYSFAFASVIIFMISIHVYFSFEGSPIIQLVSYTLLLLFAVNLFIGFIILQNSKRQARLTLPMVPLLQGDQGTLLDAGCGAGRTTIALAAAIPGTQIIAFDKFDADYIEEGGIDLFKRNIHYAGIEQNVKVEKGDITATSFNDNQFDAMISSYMFDHLGPNKQKALKESYRILKPGGRFLLIIAIRSYSTFGIANLFCLLFPTRSTWKKWIEQAGFKLVSDGKINEGAYFCFEKPLIS